MKSFLWPLVVLILIFAVVKVSTCGRRRRKDPSMKPPGNDTGLSGLLRSHVYRLSHEIGDRSPFKYARLEEAAAYIAGEFEGYGYRTELEEFPVSGKTARNIIARKVGAGKPDKVIIVGAHYDTYEKLDYKSMAAVVEGLRSVVRDLAGGARWKVESR